MKKNIKKLFVFFLFLASALLTLFVIQSLKEGDDLNVKEEKIVEIIPEGPLKIGFITDAHCYANFDKKTSTWSLNWRCRKPLEAFVRKMNEDYKPDFVIENGDLVDGRDDRSRDTFIEANQIFNQINVPKYHVLGNHETRSFIKSEWLGLVGYEKPYYYFDVKGYRIIVLDGNNKLVAGGQIIDTSPENEFYPGLIDPVQMDWLKNLLKESKGYQKIVFVHQPLAIEETKTQEQLFIKGKEFRNLFSQNKVKAVFSGHTERFCLMQENGVNYYVFNGFWKPNGGLKKEYRFKDEGVFSEILINNNEVKVTVYHNPELSSQENTGEYQFFELTPENANCSNWEAILTEEDEIDPNVNAEGE